MTGQITKFVLLAALVVGGAVALWQYEKRWSRDARHAQELAEARQKAEQLEQFVHRLTSHQRRGEMVVSEQTRNSSGDVESTTLLFVEYAPDGSRLPPRFFTIVGNVAHLDALVIKFEHDLVKEGDPLRGHSLALFYRLYGDHQKPSDGFRIDAPGATPEVYKSRGAPSPAAAQFEEELWQNFWKLADDPEYRKSKGVRVAMGEGVWRYFWPEHVYTITLDADGGLNITANPIDGVWKDYRDAIAKSRSASVQ